MTSSLRRPSTRAHSWSPGCCRSARRPNCSSRRSCATTLRAQLLRLDERLARPPLDAGAAEHLLAEARARGDATANGAGARRPRGARYVDWEVEVDRFTRLAALMTYLHDVCRAAGDEDETPVAIVDVCAALNVTPADVIGDVRLLNLVNFGGEGTLV